jgi:large subunit ribosomal protein L21
VEDTPLFLCLLRPAPDSLGRLAVYAIIKSGSKQYRVEKGDRIEVDRLPQEAGEEITLKEVLLIADGDKYQADKKTLEGAAVVARVIEERQGRKVISFDYRNKHRRRTTHGHRQIYTHLEIKDIKIGGQ